MGEAFAFRDFDDAERQFISIAKFLRGARQPDDESSDEEVDASDREIELLRKQFPEAILTGKLPRNSYMLFLIYDIAILKFNPPDLQRVFQHREREVFNHIISSYIYRF
jgi:hypothetical protein